MIEYLLFDLDNTLYSARYGFEDNVYRRIGEFLGVYLEMPPEDAKRLREERIHRYGTTLEWLRAEQGFTDIEGYYRAVHPQNEVDTLPPDPELRRFLASLSVPMAILTNSPREHADRVLTRLGIADLFPRIFDMRWNQFIGKPDAEAFRRAVSALGTTPETTLFIDDMPRCVEGYLKIGGKGVLFDEFNASPDYPHPRIQRLPELAAFLES